MLLCWLLRSDQGRPKPPGRSRGPRGGRLRFRPDLAVESRVPLLCLWPLRNLSPFTRRLGRVDASLNGTRLTLLLFLTRERERGTFKNRSTPGGFRVESCRHQCEVGRCARRPSARSQGRERGWNRSAASTLRERAIRSPAESERPERLQQRIHGF